MQARGGSSAQNQQNQNPNVNATAQTSSNSMVPPTMSEAKTANLDSVLEISMDKRNVKSNNRGGKRKRINAVGVGQETVGNSSSSSTAQ